VAGVIQDITQNKLAEQQLRHSEEKFRILFESSKEAFYFSSVQGKFIEANQSFFKLFGMEKEDLNNLWAKDIYLNLNDRSKFIDIIEKHGFVKDFEVKFMDRNGNVMDCQISATVRRSMDGSIEGYQGIIRDTTEMKQKDLEKERLIADLQKALAEVKKLSGLLPICMHCKKIRDDKGYWNQMEEYLANHSEAQFSHSICRECAQKYYPDIDFYDK
jgi:PAS domain S-box-containing protein